MWRNTLVHYTDSYVMQGVTGKADVFGFDVDGRPALYLTPSKQNTEESHRQVEFTFFMVEKLIDLMGPGVEYVYRNSNRLNILKHVSS